MTGRRSIGFCCLMFLLVAFVGAVPSAWCQEVTAAIVGTVTDSSGAAVAGAAVKVTSKERGISYTAETNGSGLYRISQLPVGTYDLKVEKSGFAVEIFPAFILTLNQVARIDATLKVGKTTETVEVTASAPILERETTQVDTTIIFLSHRATTSS
jgi:hypothetical protein